MFNLLKKIFIGNPLKTSQESHERLSNTTALAVFGADALSSVAFATEEILMVLILAGTSALQFSAPVAAAVVFLLAILAFSYNQTVHAYPDGGGAYRVASENLGKNAGLLAASALLIDYTLNAAVCACAGAAALISAFPELAPWRVLFAIAIIILVALINFRGVRESGFIFAIPTYLFISAMAVLIFTGVVRILMGNLTVTTLVQTSPYILQTTQTLSFFLLLRAFSSGCTALTGIEAISNGVKAFKSPEADNAGKTLKLLAVILAFIFIGISFFAYYLHITPQHNETVISQIASSIYGRNLLYFLTQFFTIGILFLSANTSFAGFPRLACLLARDAYLPRQLMNRGDRLVFTNGILSLAICASLLIFSFKGSVHGLIPLFAVGVFLCFLLSNAGMVVHWIKAKGKSWKTSAIVNTVGALASLSVFVAMVLTKFLQGAWIVIAMIPFMIMLFHSIKNHYEETNKQLSLKNIPNLKCIISNKVLLLVSGVHIGTLEALEYARSISKHPDDIIAIHIATNPQSIPDIKKRWDEYVKDISLHIVDSPYRSLTDPLLMYIKKIAKKYPDSFLSIIVPEFKTKSWWEDLLHNQTAMFLRLALIGKKYKAILSYRYYLHDNPKGN